MGWVELGICSVVGHFGKRLQENNQAREASSSGKHILHLQPDPLWVQVTMPPYPKERLENIIIEHAEDK